MTNIRRDNLDSEKDENRLVQYLPLKLSEILEQATYYTRRAEFQKSIELKKEIYEETEDNMNSFVEISRLAYDKMQPTDRIPNTLR